METLDKARSVIEERLKEIHHEEKRLENALKNLVTDRKRPKPSGRSSSPRKAKKRAPRGQRKKQLLASIKKHPNYKQADHAKEIGIQPNQVYGLVNKLSKSGKVKKTKNGTLSVAS